MNEETNKGLTNEGPYGAHVEETLYVQCCWLVCHSATESCALWRSVEDKLWFKRKATVS